jgi:para-nitrobenzyl esterase
VNVTTAAGTVRGATRGGRTAFLGIPFAEPPVGPDRFAAPRRAAAWDGVRDALVHGPTPQRRPFGPVTTVPEPSVPGEATLNVDVFTPDPDPAAKLPVLVWIHGGGFFAGSPASPWYDGASFCRDGVVTVNVSYRLGFDGFGWIDGAPLNRGLLDQIAALHWVQENVAAFGGDPDRVTVAGQSAGGGSVLSLLVAPAARGTFRRAVSQSGAPGDLDLAVAEAAGRRYAEHLGIAPDLNSWRGIDPERVLDTERAHNVNPARPDPAATRDTDLAAVVARARDTTSTSRSKVFVPVVDGDVLPGRVEAEVARGVGADVDLVLGATRNEFATAHDVPAETVEHMLRAAGVGEVAVARQRAEVARVGERFATSQVLASASFRSTVARLAAARIAGGAGDRTWTYDFAQRSEVSGVASHCQDLPYTFDLLGADGVTELLGPHPDTGLARRMHGDWVGFVRTGTMPWPAGSVTGAQRYGDGTGFDPDAYRLDAEIAGVGF